MWLCVLDGMLDGCGSERDCGASERGTTTMPTEKESQKVGTLSVGTIYCNTH